MTHPVKTIDALNQETSVEYLFGLGVPYQTTDPNGWLTTTTYDGLGRTLSVTAAGLGQPGVYYNYPQVDGNGRIAVPYHVEMQILDTIANQYRSVWGFYDGVGRLIQTQVYDQDKGQTLAADTYFNSQGLAWKQSLPYYRNSPGGYYLSPAGSQFNETAFDFLGRATSVTQPGGITTTTSYDGLTVTIIDPDGRKVSRTTDGLGRLVTVGEYSDSETVYATTAYTYDVGDRLIRVLDANGNESTIQYDWLGRKTGMQDPDMGVWTYAYNPQGGLIHQTDARNETLNFTYDPLGRLLTKTGNSVNTTFTYGNEAGNIGMRTGMTDASGVTTWSYGNYGRTVTENRQIGGVTESMTTATDWLGRPISVTYPDQEVLTYHYDALGRPRQLDRGQDSLVDLAYTTLGQIELQTLGNGVVISNQYNNANRLEARAALKAGIELLDYAYTYDNAGNIRQITDGILGETHVYEYDFLSRLTTAEAYTSASPTDYKYRQHFLYDRTGNIQQMNDWVIPTPQAYLEPQPFVDEFMSLGSVEGGIGAPKLAALAQQEAFTDTPSPTPSPTETATPAYTATPTFIPTNTSGPSPTPTVTPWSGADAYTSAMLHMNGALGSKTFIDETGKIWTAAGDAKIDTAQSKFSGASGLFDGTGDYIHTPDSDDWNFGPGDFTIDFWVRFNALPSPGGYMMLFQQVDNTSNYHYIYVNNSGGNLTWKVDFRDGGTSHISISAATTLSTNTWYHIAVVRNGGRIDIYQAGTAIGNDTSISTVGNLASTLRIGYDAFNSTAGVNGWIDEYRISKGIARWTSNFTPPELPYGEDGPEPTPTVTYTPSNTPTSTITPTPSMTPTSSNTPTLTMTPTPYTVTPTPSRTPTSSNTPTPTPHLGNLLAYWNFETLNGTKVPDEAQGDGTDNFANLYNGVVIETTGVDGKSAFFDGVNDYASVAHQAEISTTGSFTVSAWVNPASTVTNRTQYIVKKGGLSQDYGLITLSTQGTPTPAGPAAVNANGSIVFQAGGLTPSLLAGPILPVNTWTLVAGVYDAAAKEMRLYLNGELVAAQSVTGTLTAGASVLTFSSSAAANVYHGRLDEVRFYNRALTSAEVQIVHGLFVPPAPSATATVTLTPTVGATATPLPMIQQQWGTGADGDLVVNAGNSFNINTQGSNGRTCADAVTYNVTLLGDTSAVLSASPDVGCLNPGDELMLIQMTDTGAAGFNSGSYEFLRLASASGNTVIFTASKKYWYGNGWRSDANIGTGSGQLRVMLIRVPNYEDVTINGTLTASAFDGNKNGLVVLRVAGSLSGTGTITVSGLGFSSDSGPGTGIWTDGQWATGGGAGYGTAGVGSLGGSIYGNPQLNKLFNGSGGGTGGTYPETGYWCGPGGTQLCTQLFPSGASGGRGGGMILIAGEQIDFQGTLTANGLNGNWANHIYGGGGSGGSIRIEGGTVALNTVNAAGGTANGSPSAGQGRIAVYYFDNLSSVGGFVPQPYTALLGQPPTPVPTATSIIFANPLPWGTGQDGDLDIPSGTTFNINTSTSSNRACADGVVYSVVQLEDASIKLSSAPSSNCLLAGDEILLIHISGSGANTGNYEYLKVGGIIGDTLYPTTQKKEWYGANAGDDTNVGTAAGQQKVIIQRVPNYEDVTINGTLTASAFDGNKNGLVVLRVAGSLSGTGTITVSGLGFGAASGYGAGLSTSGQWATGGGAGYGTAGVGSLGGSVYGNPQLNKFFNGSGGGTGGTYPDTGYYCGPGGKKKCTLWYPSGASGGRGGGMIFIAGEQIDFQGTLTANGLNGNWANHIYGGGGSGGSIRIEGGTVALNTVNAAGGTANGSPSAGQGRIAVYYYNSFTGNFTPGYLEHVNPNATPSPTPTGSTATPTSTVEVTPPPAGWQGREYSYDADHPHAVSSLTQDSATVASYQYDANGNMTCRIEDGATYKQVYNAENRISSIQKLAEGTCDDVIKIAMQWDFAYDGDGVRVTTLATSYDEGGSPQTPELTSYFFGGAYETRSSGGTIKYYAFAGQTIAMDDGTGLQYFLSDHLGSVVAVTDSSGTLTSQQRYLPFGGVRSDVNDITQTDYGYTGQRALDSGIGLMDYKARFYSPYLNRFIQPDTIVPDPSNPQAFNRYSYVYGNPLRYIDPTGHGTECGFGESCVVDPYTNPILPIKTVNNTGNGSSSSSGGGQACSGQNQSIMCPSVEDTPFTLPNNPMIPFQDLSNMPITQPDAQNPVPNANELLLYWDYILSPLEDGLDMHEAYVLASSKWYKTAVWTLPTGPIEAGIAGYRQYYKDSWFPKTYTPAQRSARVLVVSMEALAIDGISNALGTIAAGGGGSALGPIGAAGGYGVTAYAASKAGHNLADKFNTWIFPIVGLGDF
ncbi:MAG: RHS repeat-associated core domain-containing protein [Anaerolineales bacterium]|nr:MAG: RHS repeat-associated core domain-containing protein [Anaerolineales bacterium]